MTLSQSVIKEITIKNLTPYREIDETIGIDEDIIAEYNRELNEPLIPKDELDPDFIEAFLKWHNDINPDKGREFEEYSKYIEKHGDPFYSLWAIGAYINEQLKANKESKEVASRLSNLFGEAAYRKLQEDNDGYAYEELSLLAEKSELVFEIYRKLKEFEKKYEKVIDAIERETEQYT